MMCSGQIQTVALCYTPNICVYSVFGQKYANIVPLLKVSFQNLGLAWLWTCDVKTRTYFKALCFTVLQSMLGIEHSDDKVAYEHSDIEIHSVKLWQTNFLETVLWYDPFYCGSIWLYALFYTLDITELNLQINQGVHIVLSMKCAFMFQYKSESRSTLTC